MVRCAAANPILLAVAAEWSALSAADRRAAYPAAFDADANADDVRRAVAMAAVFDAVAYQSLFDPKRQYSEQEREHAPMAAPAPIAMDADSEERYAADPLSGTQSFLEKLVDAADRTRDSLDWKPYFSLFERMKVETVRAPVLAHMSAKLGDDAEWSGE